MAKISKKLKVGLTPAERSIMVKNEIIQLLNVPTQAGTYKLVVNVNSETGQVSYSWVKEI